ncbi:3-oxoacyl-acp reductase [Diplodia corticola]|uniref:3-oxoacyl-[acyl-carrier-protein] reductase n=1 Tax=Diplodia corticola TaxID=236234 RepID=A0A1J9QWF6_9PEZI|nr:3-oxoacyl-acp reductase [Diplodia corticola]OJD32338.1 3-oxoacyl-acp reductase [Diplodia corticola]
MSALTTDLSSQLALVTGASGGIGKATCLALADMGCSIAVHYHTNSDAANALVDQLKAKGVNVQALQADLSIYDEARKLYSSVSSSLGSPKILFNNAGSALSKPGLRSASDISIEDFELTWRSNCGSAFLLTQLCLPDMEKAGWGRVIFCSSVAGLNGGVLGPHYASSKSALHGLVHWLAGAYAAKGITVNGVAPALIQAAAMLPASNEQLAKRLPVGRLGRPEEIAETVLWMVKTGYVTSKIVTVDGGLLAI